MKTPGKTFLPALLALAFALAQGCGTEAGNPGPLTSANYTETGPMAGSPTASQLASSQLISTICAKLHSCYPSLSESACSTGILASSQLDTEIGLAPGFGTYQSIINAETAGTITPDSSAVSACSQAIYSLSCSSPQAQSAYNPAQPSDFSNVPNLIPAGNNCSGVF